MSGRYHIKWTRLADIPAPVNATYVTVQDKHVYVCGGDSSDYNGIYQVYVYEIDKDHWDQLPLSDHYLGVPCMIGGKLTIIGGRLSSTKKRTNKVSTFDQVTQTWMSYYPDLLSVRSRPGVVAHLEYVIVAGGGKGDDALVVQDDIEVLNWIENSCWKKVSVNLPVPMYGFTPSIADDYLYIANYIGDDMVFSTEAYKIPVKYIIAPEVQEYEWIALTPTSHFKTSLMPGSSPPVVAGGEDDTGMPTAAVMMFDVSSRSWKNVGSLSSARSIAAIAAVNTNAVIIIGGCTSGATRNTAISSSLNTVELGQAELIQ